MAQLQETGQQREPALAAISARGTAAAQGHSRSPQREWKFMPEKQQQHILPILSLVKWIEAKKEIYVGVLLMF